MRARFMLLHYVVYKVAICVYIYHLEALRIISSNEIARY